MCVDRGIKACLPNPKIFGSALNGHLCHPSPPKQIIRTLYIQYPIICSIFFVNRIRFNWIGEQYTSLCCWLIPMFRHKPVSLLSLEWTALLTIVWFTVSYRIYFMAHRLLPSSAPAPTPAKLGWDSLNVRTDWNPPTTHPPRIVVWSTYIAKNDLFMTCTWLVHDLFNICSWLVNDLFMTCSQIWSH